MKLSEDHTLYIAPNSEKSFMVPREQMPQIASKDIKDFLKQNGVEYNESTVRPDLLKPTQSQFNPEKIATIDEKGRSMPILISNDDYVLDGHHRWLANHFSKSYQKVIILPWDAATSLEKMNSYEKTFSKGIHEDSAAAVSIGAGAIDNKVVAVDKKKIKSFKVWKRTDDV